jgi:hypothetical protein
MSLQEGSTLHGRMLASGPLVSQTPRSLTDVNQLQRIAVIAPGFEAAGEWTHSNHPFAEQLQRRTGAGGFVWSRTI